MNVKQLIDELQQYPDEMPVHFAYNYGDHWRTRVAPQVRHAEELSVVESDYHSMPMVVDEDDRRYDAAAQVVVLHG
jgi:hypothetical protein